MSNVTTLHKQIWDCHACELVDQCTKPVPYSGPRNPRFGVVGEAPGRREDRVNEPFMGAAGRLLKRTMGEYGVDPTTAMYFNAVSCYPHGTPTNDQLHACRQNFLDQLSLLPHDSLILSCGRTALHSFVQDAQLSYVANTIMHVTYMPQRPLVLPIYHPASLLYKEDYKPMFRSGIATLAGILQGILDPYDLISNHCVFCGKAIVQMPGLEIGVPHCRQHKNIYGKNRGREKRERIWRNKAKQQELW